MYKLLKKKFNMPSCFSNSCFIPKRLLLLQRILPCPILSYILLCSILKIKLYIYSQFTLVFRNIFPRQRSRQMNWHVMTSQPHSGSPYVTFFLFFVCFVFVFVFSIISFKCGMRRFHETKQMWHIRFLLNWCFNHFIHLCNTNIS